MTRPRVFSRAFCQLHIHVIITWSASFDWFTVLSVFLVIGWSIYTGFGFTTTSVNHSSYDFTSNFASSFYSRMEKSCLVLFRVLNYVWNGSTRGNTNIANAQAKTWFHEKCSNFQFFSKPFSFSTHKRIQLCSRSWLLAVFFKFS